MQKALPARQKRCWARSAEGGAKAEEAEHPMLAVLFEGGAFCWGWVPARARGACRKR